MREIIGIGMPPRGLKRGVCASATPRCEAVCHKHSLLVSLNVLVMACVTAFLLILPLSAERPYDFRARLDTVHEKNRRDGSALPNQDEFVIPSGAVIATSDDVDDVLALAIKDFCDYLDVSMGVSARFSRGGCGTISVSIDRSMPPRAYRIETGEGRLRRCII